MTVHLEDAKGTLPFIVWRQNAVKRISSSRSLGALLAAACPAESVEKKGCMIDDYFCKKINKIKKKNSSRLAAGAEKWITGILFICCSCREEANNFWLIGQRKPFRQDKGREKGGNGVYLLVSVAD